MRAACSAVRIFASPKAGWMRRRVSSSIAARPCRTFSGSSVGSSSAASSRAALARATIARYDQDGDGRLNKTELAQFIGELSPGGSAESNTPQDWVEKNIAPLLAPLISFVQTPRTWDPPPDPSELMKTIDNDNDGFVTEEELLQWWSSFKPFDPSTQTAPALIHRWAGTVVDSIVLCGPLWVVHILTGGVLGPLYSITASLVYTFRDCLFNNGSRSLGKKLLSLEIVQVEKDADGLNRPTDRIATLQHCIMRNGYMLPFFVVGQIPLDLGVIDIAVGVSTAVVTLANVWFVLFVSCRRTVGDRLAGTMVVYEGPNYVQRSLARALMAAGSDKSSSRQK